MGRVARQNYPEECEAALNRQINLQLTASNTFLSMYGYFGQDEIALEGMWKLFKRHSDQAPEDAVRLTRYQNMRGGRLRLADIKGPRTNGWESPYDVMLIALQLEKELNDGLLQLQAVAEEKKDTEMSHEIKSFYLADKAETLKKLGNYIANLRRVGGGLGEYQFAAKSLDC